MASGYLKLMRPANCAMTALSVLVGAMLVTKFGAFYSLATYIAIIAAFIISGAGNAINDYVDIEADKVNKPNRPLASGKIKPKAALGFSMTLFILGMVMASFINPIALVIAVVNSLLLITYSFYLKERMLIGNASVSYLVGSGFLFGGAAMGNLVLPAVMFFLSAFANMAREIAKDMEDIKGDRLMFLKKAMTKVKRKLAHRFNMDISGNVKLRYRPRVLSVIAALCLAIAIAVSPIPFMKGMLGFVYLGLLVPTDLLFLYSIFMFSRHQKKQREYAKISKTIKMGMFFGLLAFLLGALI